MGAAVGAGPLEIKRAKALLKEKIDLIVEMDHLNQETTPDVIFDLISGI